jgi:hypothetical protein
MDPFSYRNDHYRFSLILGLSGQDQNTFHEQHRWYPLKTIKDYKQIKLGDEFRFLLILPMLLSLTRISSFHFKRNDLYGLQQR